MKITVIGCGYLGAVHAAGLAALGHDVVGIELDADRALALGAGRVPFYEPGLADLLTSTVASGRLRFTDDPAAARDHDVHFVCVGTPQRPGEQAADLSYVEAALDNLIPHLRPGDLVVGKSTVPVGTASRLAERLRAAVPGAGLAWNPEFLREGFAIEDTLRPDRLVFGVADRDDAAVSALERVYASVIAAGTPVLVADLATAELVKVAANAFLATKISFINAMAELCELTGADVTQLADALGHDARIGRRFLNAGVGFGGGCLPKDIRAFAARAGELGAGSSLAFLTEVDKINLRRRERVVTLASEACGGQVFGRRIAVLGAAFKPDSDDIRDSPALDVARRLQELGARVVVTDPQALPNVAARYPELELVETVAEATAGCDVVLLLTEWPQYRGLDPEAIGRRVRRREIVDGRNVIDRDVWRSAGWTVRSMGRPTVVGRAPEERAA